MDLGISEPLASVESGQKFSTELDNPQYYINRELSLLEFQSRVLEEAQDEGNPLLERVKFLAIVGSNLDEFFMVRVAGLKQQIAAGVHEISADGLTPAEQLAAVRKAATKLMLQARDCLLLNILPALTHAGIHLLDYAELNEKQRAKVSKYFEEVVFPVLTPLAFDPGRPFPHISNLSLNLAILIRDPQGAKHFARLKVPDTLPQLVPIKRSSGSLREDGTVPYKHSFVWLDQVMMANLGALFPGMEILEAHPFRVTRNADMMPRNQDHRVEILFPIEDPKLVRQLRQEVLAVYLSDDVKARWMSPDGSYTRRVAGEGQPPVNSQAWFLKPKPTPLSP
jgi:polyphosphate kinase